MRIITVDTKNMAVLITKDGAERPLPDWKRFRPVVYEFVFSRLSQPYPPRVQFSGKDADELMDKLKQADPLLQP